MSESYSDWIRNVDATLRSINMSLEEWQRLWPFNFQQEFNAGVKPDDAAMKANRYWWFRQNKSLNRQCEKTPNCWLPRGHQGLCELASVPMYEPGDFVKVEFPDEATGVGEWMWVRVIRCDEQNKIVFGRLDNEPINDHGDKIGLGSELAISFYRIREHRKPTEFTTQ